MTTTMQTFDAAIMSAEMQAAADAATGKRPAPWSVASDAIDACGAPRGLAVVWSVVVGAYERAYARRVAAEAYFAAVESDDAIGESSLDESAPTVRGRAASSAVEPSSAPASSDDSPITIRCPAFAPVARDVSALVTFA